MWEIRNGCASGVKHDRFCNGKTRNVGPEDARPFGGPRAFFGECGSFQGDYENAPYGGDQADNKKRFGDKRVRVDGNTNGVENFHQHQHDQQMIEDLQCLVGDGPVTQSLPKHLGGIGDRGAGSGKKKYGKNRIDKHFGFNEVVAKMMS